MNTDQILKLYELKQRLELMDLVQSADDERVRLLLRIISADPRSLEAALSKEKRSRCKD